MAGWAWPPFQNLLPNPWEVSGLSGEPYPKQLATSSSYECHLLRGINKIKTAEANIGNLKPVSFQLLQSVDSMPRGLSAYFIRDGLVCTTVVHPGKCAEAKKAS